MNLLVGSTGFVGGHVVEYLFQQNEISRGTFRRGAHLKIMDLNGVQGVEADLLDHHTLHEAVEGTDTIYSIASPMPDFDDDFERINTEGMENLLEVANEMKVKTIVHLSTLDVYGFRAGTVSESSELNPSGRYQDSKLRADRALLEFAKRNRETRVAIIRASRAVGSRDQSLTVPLLRMIESGKVVLPTSGVMSFSHPKDIAQAMYRAATSQSSSGKLYLVKSFDSSPEALVKMLARNLGKSVEFRKRGMTAKSLLPPYTADQLKASLVLQEQASWKEIGFEPKYGLEQACEEVTAWYRKDPWAIEPA